jgi:hypothetical protein
VSIHALLEMLRGTGQFEQVMLVAETGHKRLSQIKTKDLPALLPSNDKRDNVPSFSVIGDAISTFRPIRRKDAPVLPMTESIIELIERTPPGLPFDTRRLNSLLNMRAGTRVDSYGALNFHRVHQADMPAVSNWLDYFSQGVRSANQRGHEADVAALQAYDRAFAMREDAPDREDLARLLVYRAAMRKRLGRPQEAKTELQMSETTWSGTEIEDDAWYNLASVCAMLGERDAMLDALFAIKGTESYGVAVRNHLNDYFAKFKADRELLIFASGEQPKVRNMWSLKSGEFFSEREILAHAGKSTDLGRGERPRRALIIFDTATQHTWLVATRLSLIFVLDDANTRHQRRIVQRVMPLANVPPVSAEIRVGGEAVVGFGEGASRRWWYYSQKLFRRPADIEHAVMNLVKESSV